ncbi:hypothetical protein ACWEFJ_22260 [Actinosynnema sp. NPDC004786]
MRFDSDKDIDFAEDADPGSFPTERSRRRAIGLDRWSGRHPVLVTLLTGASLGVLMWWALLDVRPEKLGSRLVIYVAFVVAATVLVARFALKARKRYYGR